MATDSTGRPIRVGDRVRFCGEEYTIKALHPGLGIHGTCWVEFEEPQYTDEPADEASVDLILGPSCRRLGVDDGEDATDGIGPAMRGLKGERREPG